MTYAEFKEYVLYNLWREGDADLAATLDNLIYEGEDKLNTDIKDERQTVMLEATTSSKEIVLPVDYHRLKSLHVGDERTQSVFMTSNQFWEFDAKHTSCREKFYTKIGNSLFINGNIGEDNPEQYRLVYQERVPHWKDLPSSEDNPFRVRHSNLYKSVILRQCIIPLRDDARYALFDAEYKDALASYLDYHTDDEFPTAPLNVRMPGEVA